MTYKHHRRCQKLCPLAWMHAWHLCDMDWWTFSNILDVPRIVATAMEIHATRSISEFTGLSYIYLLFTLFSLWHLIENKEEEINQVIWEKDMPWDHHTQSSCFWMSRPNGRVLILRNEMPPHHVETTFRVEYMQGLVKHFWKNLLKKDETLASVQSSW